jgi:hypothetical protein
MNTKEGLEGSKTIVDIAFAAKLIAPFFKPHICFKILPLLLVLICINYYVLSYVLGLMMIEYCYKIINYDSILSRPISCSNGHDPFELGFNFPMRFCF